METALEIAFVLDHPVYDCLYLALAELRDGEFITVDKRLLRVAQQHGRLKGRISSL